MTPRPHNAFLLGLGSEDYAKVADAMVRIDLDLGRQLYPSGGEVDWVYFPETSLLSLISIDNEGQTVETSMVGEEGAAGLLEACGSGQSGVDYVVQVDGRAWRMPASFCRKLVAASPDFAARAWAAIELQLAETRQSGLCQAMHPVPARFARWLLESLERSGRRNPLPLTQEFLAAMLGVQRTTVSAFASQLQREGLISYARGRIQIVDERALEQRACECRQVTRGQRIRLGFSTPGRA